MATRSIAKPSTVVYSVGEDITPEKYQELIVAVGDWFSEVRTTKEPTALAKQIIDACLRGVKPSDGKTPWSGAELSTLATRVRMACRYDMEKMLPIRTGSEKQRTKKAAEKARKQVQRDAVSKDANYPDEYTSTARGTARAAAANAVYGDDPLVFFTTQEQEIRARMREGYVEQFPQLDNIAQSGKLDMLLDLMILQQRLRFRNAKPDRKGEIRATEEAMGTLTKQIIELERAMGIDPVSISKMQREREGGSIGDAVQRFEGMGDWKQLRLKLWAEELLLIYQMFCTPSPRTDMGGYQLDEVGLYGLTKSRVVSCPHCAKQNFAGIAIEEIEAWLIAKGHLVPIAEPVAEPLVLAAAE